jgi:hypothetical protein
MFCHVPKAHGEAPKAYGKGFAMGYTRQMAHDSQHDSKVLFAVYPLSRTRQTRSTTSTYDIMRY